MLPKARSCGLKPIRVYSRAWIRRKVRPRPKVIASPAISPIFGNNPGYEVFRYDRQTGAFVAFNRNGTIRTFFKPNDGERYYRCQAERGE